MATDNVHLDADAYLVCLTHALSTEKEEIMGLLIGEMTEDRTCHISSVILLSRSDKRPDRVEISPEQLAEASNVADRLAIEMKKPMRVVGWYHSHPHITVWPSHVDVATQSMYQLMDERFVGLIFSVFNEDKHTKVNKMQVACFQSINQSPEGEAPQIVRHDVPLVIVPTQNIRKPNLECLIKLPKLLAEEERELYQRTRTAGGKDILTEIHNASVYSKSLCHILKICSGPLMQALQTRLSNNLTEIEQLKAEKIKLAKLLQESSPNQSTIV